MIYLLLIITVIKVSNVTYQFLSHSLGDSPGIMVHHNLSATVMAERTRCQLTSTSKQTQLVQFTGPFWIYETTWAPCKTQGLGLLHVALQTIWQSTYHMKISALISVSSILHWVMLCLQLFLWVCNCRYFVAHEWQGKRDSTHLPGHPSKLLFPVRFLALLVAILTKSQMSLFVRSVTCHWMHLVSFLFSIDLHDLKTHAGYWGSAGRTVFFSSIGHPPHCHCFQVHQRCCIWGIHTHWLSLVERILHDMVGH